MRLALAVLGMLSACAASRGREVEALPLRAGARWVYRGQVTVPDPKNPARAATHEVTWTVSVRGVTVRPDGVVSELIGDLSDLDFWDARRKPSDVFVIRRGSRYFRAHARGAEGDLFLALPLEPGQRLCNDERLCWVVDRIDRAAVTGVRGAPTGERPRYFLSQRDNTGVKHMVIVPGLGITAYRYHHHGSISDVDVRLVAYRPGR